MTPRGFFAKIFVVFGREICQRFIRNIFILGDLQLDCIGIMDGDKMGIEDFFLGIVIVNNEITSQV